MVTMVVPNFRSISEIQLFSIHLLSVLLSAQVQLQKCYSQTISSRAGSIEGVSGGEGAGAGLREWPQHGLRDPGTELGLGSKGYAPGSS